MRRDVRARPQPCRKDCSDRGNPRDEGYGRGVSGFLNPMVSTGIPEIGTYRAHCFENWGLRTAPLSSNDPGQKGTDWPDEYGWPYRSMERRLEWETCKPSQKRISDPTG